jgi:PPOX class probable F420-dependent enzyme
MADTDMTDAERDEFLDGVHVGILSIARDGKGPLALPVWYDHDGDDIVIFMSSSSPKARLLRTYGRATFTVQDERPPYRYVMVEGPVTVVDERHDVTEMATRYLGPELGAQYAAANPPSDDSATVRLHIERSLTCDYGKLMS